MNIPRHWARGEASAQDPATGELHETSAYGWSDVSIADATRSAIERAQRVAQWLRSDQEQDLDRYAYGADRPLREMVVRELGSGDRRLAAITRNQSGALVLNTPNVAFIDVDVPKRGFVAGLMDRIRGRTGVAERAALERMQAASDAHRTLGIRIYRTAGGFRCLITSGLFDPVASATAELFTAFGCDPRYTALCRVQRSFRARLTPKPWRCGLHRPPAQFPFADADAEATHAAWVREYEAVSARHAVCELVETRGPAYVEPTAAVLIREHDAATVSHGKPLA